MSRHRKSQSNYDTLDHTFMEDLQQSLLQPQDIYGIDAFEGVFNKKKLIAQMIAKEKKMKEEADDACTRAKQRVVQIQQLQGKVDKQTSLLKSQIDKIAEVHNMAKLLMMQKILRLQRETEQLQRKRRQCHQMRIDHDRSTIANMARHVRRIELSRNGLLSNTIVLRDQHQERSLETIEDNRRRAESVRLDKQRRRGRLQRIEQYKLDRAKSNYKSKVEGMKSTLELGEEELNTLAMKEMEEERHMAVTERVTAEYLNSFFTTGVLE